MTGLVITYEAGISPDALEVAALLTDPWFLGGAMVLETLALGLTVAWVRRLWRAWRDGWPIWRARWMSDRDPWENYSRAPLTDRDIATLRWAAEVVKKHAQMLESGAAFMRFKKLAWLVLSLGVASGLLVNSGGLLEVLQ